MRTFGVFYYISAKSHQYQNLSQITLRLGKQFESMFIIIKLVKSFISFKTKLLQAFIEPF